MCRTATPALVQTAPIPPPAAKPPGVVGNAGQRSAIGKRAIADSLESENIVK